MKRSSEVRELQEFRRNPLDTFQESKAFGLREKL
jgi:hypothetical protein